MSYREEVDRLLAEGRAETRELMITELTEGMNGADAARFRELYYEIDNASRELRQGLLTFLMYLGVTDRMIDMLIYGDSTIEAPIGILNSETAGWDGDR